MTPELPNGREYAMEAPKAMIRAGLAEPGELWLAVPNGGRNTGMLQLQRQDGPLQAVVK